MNVVFRLGAAGLRMRARRGDDSSQPLDASDFAGLYGLHRDRVYAYSLAILHDPEAAADVTAAAFERALRRLDSCRGGTDGFAPWICRIARNLAIDHHRRLARFDSAPMLAEVAAPPHDGPEDMALKRDGSTELHRALAELTELERECLALRYGAGLTARQIGAVVGKTDSATQKLMQRALMRLREKL
jgi:RNA polymerase sigma-70 factor (ECF subfamily)